MNSPVFEHFEVLPCQQQHTGFVSSINHFGYKNSVHLLCCEFEPLQFSDEYFSMYGITLPDGMQKAVKKRKAEFFAGRFLAKRALSALGLSAEHSEVGVATDRSPIWPSGVVGSITHTTHFALCCVGKKTDVSTIGIDSELILTADTAQQLATEIHSSTELEVLSAAGFATPLATTLIFSAKESLYKALYPQVRCYFGFETAQLIGIDQQNHCLLLSLCHRFAALYGLKTKYKIQFSIKRSMVHTLLMQ